MSSGELLKMLQKSAKNGSLLPSCEPEVKELMHQLDVLISQHQREWEEQARKAKSQLQLRDNELATLRISLHERTNQLERLRLQTAEKEQEHRARQADCEAQLVRVKSELTRLRHSYEQLRAKRNLQSKTSNESTNYKLEWQSLRKQVSAMKEREREMERQSKELMELLKKRGEHVEGLEVKGRQSEVSLAYLQETLKSKDGQIRKLEEAVGVSRISADSEMQQLKQELRAHLQVEQELREAVRRAEEEAGVWREELAKVKGEQGKRESQVVLKLEERVHKLERELRESRHNSNAVKQFEEKAEEFLQHSIGSGKERTYVALEPVHQQASVSVDNDRKWSELLENILGKHFDQLDCSLQKMLSPN